MFRPNYRECFVITTVVADPNDGKMKLGYEMADPNTGQTYYELMPTHNDVLCFKNNQMSVGVNGFEGEVLAHVVYPSENRELMLNYVGYIADNSTPEGRRAILTHPRYAEFWSMKMSEYLGTYDEQGNLIPYTGADANDPAPCCVFLQSDYEDR